MTASRELERITPTTWWLASSIVSELFTSYSEWIHPHHCADWSNIQKVSAALPCLTSKLALWILAWLSLRSKLTSWNVSTRWIVHKSIPRTEQIKDSACSNRSVLRNGCAPKLNKVILNYWAYTLIRLHDLLNIILRLDTPLSTNLLSPCVHDFTSMWSTNPQSPLICRCLARACVSIQMPRQSMCEYGVLAGRKVRAFRISSIHV